MAAKERHSMNATHAAQIRNIWEMFEKQFPGKSTEFLLEVTAQEASRVFRHRYDCGHITDALVQTKVFTNKG
jgi:hypothetical protein